MGGKGTKNLENRMLIFCKAFKIQLTYSTRPTLKGTNGFSQTKHL